MPSIIQSPSAAAQSGPLDDIDTASMNYMSLSRPK